jgi:undecaprenyl-diphosphatase
LIAAIDQAVLAAFHHARTPFLDYFFSGLTWLGSLWLLLPAAFIAGSWLETAQMSLRGVSLRLAGMLLTCAVLCTGLKWLAGRARPGLYEVLGSMPVDPAFPSAHSAQAMAMALGLALLLPVELRYLGGLLTALALLVGISRLYLQVHWPSDVLAGWLIGALCALAMFWLSPEALKK